MAGVGTCQDVVATPVPGDCTSYSYTNLSGQGNSAPGLGGGYCKATFKNVNLSTKRNGRRIGNKDGIYQDLWERNCKEKRPFQERMLGNNVSSALYPNTCALQSQGDPKQPLSYKRERRGP